MKNEQLYESRNERNDLILERSEKAGKGWRNIKIWVTLAAGFCVLAGALLVNRQPVVQDGFVYNDSAAAGVLRDEPVGSFSKELDGEALTAILPEKLPEGVNCAGYTRFSPEGTLMYIQLQITSANTDLEMQVTLEPANRRPRSLGVNNPVVSQCGDEKYTLYQSNFKTPHESGFVLHATAQINKVNYLFELYGNADLEAQAKEDFEGVLTSFATYPSGKPDISVITGDHE